MIEEIETSNEELQVANEELIASNEELQSTNEELHSVNEELYTVNAEHQRRVEELAQANHESGDTSSGVVMTLIDITDPRAIGNPITYANQGFLKLTGYEHDEVIGRNCKFLQGEDTDRASIKLIREALDRGEVARVALRPCPRTKKSPGFQKSILECFSRTTAATFGKSESTSSSPSKRGVRPVRVDTDENGRIPDRSVDGERRVNQRHG